MIHMDPLKRKKKPIKIPAYALSKLKEEHTHDTYDAFDEMMKL